jgi:transcription antitermination factor NusG
MTLWVIATTTGQELNVQEQLEALGIECAVPRKVELIRQGKRRRPDAITSAYLPGYAFAWFSTDDWHAIRGAKHVRTMMGVSAQSERLVRAFISRVEADYAGMMARIKKANAIKNAHERRKALCEAAAAAADYAPGEMLRLMTGEFADKLVAFGRMVQEAHDAYPMIEGEMQLFGQVVKVKADPADVRRAAR